MKNILFVFVLLSSAVSAQSYFQQEVNYKINVTLNDNKHELSAFENIEYINNSPNTLNEIYMHLWPNAYKNNSTAMAKQLLESGDTKFYYSTPQERGYIDSLDFKVNDKTVTWKFLHDSIDICKIILNTPLKSGEKIIITTPFHVKIPSGIFSRLGHIDQSYQITQWYPKPAVYDKNGWNYMPYLTQGEFYSEFGSFDVSITVPKNYVLGATGDLQNEDEIKWLTNKADETAAMEWASSKKTNMEFPKSDTETKTLRFIQSNVHDFAWFCDKRYHVLKGEVVTPHTKNKVTTWVMFTNKEAHLWKNSITYMNDAIYYYSLWNGDYPYKHCTAVDGTISAGGGMEYPNITVIGGSGSAFGLETVIMHEVGHNWFYGMLGSNERVHPWMDEGLNSFNENRYIETKYPEKKLIGGAAESAIGSFFDVKQYKHKTEYELTYLFSARKNEDQPIEYPAYKYTQINYGGIVYSKTAIVFDYLMAYLGEKKMDASMQKYFEKWHFKHPQPEDLRKVLEEETGKNLSWFFDDMINSTKKLDYKIVAANQKENKSWDITIKNTGDINGPVFLQGIKNNKVIAMMIYDGFNGKQTLEFPSAEVDYFKIDYIEDMPEINRNNNTLYTHGLFKKVEPLKFQFLGSLDNPNKSQLFWCPVGGWNNYNKWMFGLAVYNNIFPQKRFEFELMPMYSIATKNIAGYGKAVYNILPKGNIFKKIAVGSMASRYAYSNKPFDLFFTKIAPEITIQFKNKEERNPFSYTLKYRNISILQDYYTAQYDFTPPIYSRDSLFYNFNDLNFTISKSHAITPYKLNINLQHREKMTKASLTFDYHYKFKKKNKGIDVRFFAGTFIATSLKDAGPYRFRLSGWRGYQDYLYDNVYMGRTETEGILANHLYENDGAFKLFTNLGQSGKWITALNVKSSLGNVTLPLNLYADIGTTADDGLLNDKFLYNAGICISLVKNMCEVYFPIAMSKDLENNKNLITDNYLQTIRFTLNLNLANPFELVRNFKL